MQAVSEAAVLCDPPRIEQIAAAIVVFVGQRMDVDRQSLAQRLRVLAEEGRLRRHVKRAPAGGSEVMYWALPPHPGAEERAAAS